MPEPIYFVIERGVSGQEIACLYFDRLFSRATERVYTLRIDKLPPEQQQFWLGKSLVELLDVYRWLRDEGTLPPSNLTDPPKEKPRQGRELGNWWTQPVPPWPQRPPDPLPDAETWQPDTARGRYIGLRPADTTRNQ